MKVSELQARLGAVRAGGGRSDAEISGWYAGDLLSHVMGRIPEGAAWFTIMNNVNVAAVAALTEAACVVLCEGVTPDAALAEKAAENGIALLLAADDVFTAIRKALP